MLDKVKAALRLTSDVFDGELSLIIQDALSELAMLGVYNEFSGDEDPQIVSAVICYAKWKFGDNDSAERWEHIYHDKVEKLISAAGYGGADGQI